MSRAWDDSFQQTAFKHTTAKQLEKPIIPNLSEDDHELITEELFEMEEDECDDYWNISSTSKNFMATISTISETRKRKKPDTFTGNVLVELLPLIKKFVVYNYQFF